MAASKARLAVEIDGKRLPDDEAREVWARFSQFMDENDADMLAFAKDEGVASVATRTTGGQAVLIVTSAK